MQAHIKYKTAKYGIILIYLHAFNHQSKQTNKKKSEGHRQILSPPSGQVISNHWYLHQQKFMFHIRPSKYCMAVLAYYYLACVALDGAHQVRSPQDGPSKPYKNYWSLVWREKGQHHLAWSLKGYCGSFVLVGSLSLTQYACTRVGLGYFGYLNIFSLYQQT